MVLIVFGFQVFLMFVYQAFNVSNSMRRDPEISSQQNWIKPVLAFTIGSPNVNMRRLTTFV
jgi:hypothetical protein